MGISGGRDKVGNYQITGWFHERISKLIPFTSVGTVRVYSRDQKAFRNYHTNCSEELKNINM